jgi:hypothetical protein
VGKSRRRRAEGSAPAEEGRGDAPGGQGTDALLPPDDTEAEVAALTRALRRAPGFWLGKQTLQRLITDSWPARTS